MQDNNSATTASPVKPSDESVATTPPDNSVAASAVDEVLEVLEFDIVDTFQPLKTRRHFDPPKQLSVAALNKGFTVMPSDNPHRCGDEKACKNRVAVKHYGGTSTSYVCGAITQRQCIKKGLKMNLSDLHPVDLTYYSDSKGIKRPVCSQVSAYNGMLYQRTMGAQAKRAGRNVIQLFKNMF